MENVIIRPYAAGDEIKIAELIAVTMRKSNKNDYSSDEIEEMITEHSLEFFSERAAESHFYVAFDNNKMIGCGGITGYWGSKTESYLLSIFVLPEYQGKGIGSKIVRTLEKDEYFSRACRTEVGSSITAVGFYRKLGYEYKNGITTPDEDNVIRLEKRK